MYRYERRDGWYHIQEEIDPILRNIGRTLDESDAEKIVTALNFYEQHHQEHTCYLCGHTGSDVILHVQMLGQDYMCEDADACTNRAEKMESKP